jgi:hypothetical protein
MFHVEQFRIVGATSPKQFVWTDSSLGDSFPQSPCDKLMRGCR